MYNGYNERDEAEFVIGRIQDRVAQGNARTETPVLYRSNAQSRSFEEMLLREGIPYRVYGGLRFFERAEIKDALAYLRLLANRDDDASFERVVNLPTRGIGARTVEVMRDYARAYSCPCGNQPDRWPAASSPAARRVHYRCSCMLIERMDHGTPGPELHEQVDHVIRIVV